jgi:host factor-I protein
MGAPIIIPGFSTLPIICSTLKFGKTMPSKGRQRLQEVFLSQLIKNQTPVTVSLLNGVRLEGFVSSYDDFCISLVRDGQVQAIYKQEISIISTTAPISLNGMPDDAPPRPTFATKPALKAAPKPVVVEHRRRFRTPG